MLKTFSNLWKQAPVWRYTAILAMFFTVLILIRIDGGGPGPRPILKKPVFDKNAIRLEWLGMTGFQGSYIVKRKNKFLYEKISTNINDLRFNDQNFNFGEKYTYKIEAIDGNKKIDSNSVDIKIPIPSFKITTLKIDVETTQTSDMVTLKFKWEGQGSLGLDGVREFVLYENGLPIGRISSPQTAYEYKLELSNCREQYTYRILSELVDGKAGEALEQKYSLPLPKPSNLAIDFSNQEKPKLTWKLPDQCKKLIKNFEVRRNDKVITTTNETQYDIPESEFCRLVIYSIRAKGNDDTYGLPADKKFSSYKTFGKLTNSECYFKGAGNYRISWKPIGSEDKEIFERCSFKSYRIEKQNGDHWDILRDIVDVTERYHTIKNGDNSKYRLSIVNNNNQRGEETIVKIYNDRCEIK